MKRAKILLDFLPFTILFSFFIGAYTDLSKNISDEKHDMIQQLVLTESNINEVTYHNINKMIGVTTYISINTDIDIKELDYFVQKVVHPDTDIIRNIGVFEDTTAIYLYPYEPNKVMDNINLVDIPSQKDDALKVKNNLKVVITPPVELVQGGIGIMTRMPIILPNGLYWGQLGYMMELDDIITKLFLDIDKYNYIITQYDDDSNFSHTIFDSGVGHNILVDNIIITLPSGYWTVQIGYNNFFELISPVFYIMIISAIIFFGLSLYVISKFKRSEDKFKTSIKYAPIPIMLFNDIGKVININKKWTEISGYGLKDIPTRSDWFEKSLIEPNAQTEKYFDNIFETPGLIHVGESKMICSDGTVKIWDFNSVEIGHSNHEEKLIMTVVNDITEKKKLQEQLLNKSKMDVVVQLAEGIAHDFNNALNGIVSSAELLQMEHLNLNEKALDYVNLIIESSSRATSLSSKLLSFSSNNNTLLKHVDLHNVINELEEILRRTINKNIHIEIELNADYFVVLGDGNELNNCLLNLFINATEAMPYGGTLIIKSKNCFYNKGHNQNDFILNPGDYCCLEIIDTGNGIPEKEINKIFEPFFTTKEKGKNTGLGLAAVYGMVLKQKGLIEVESVVDKGSTFRLMLPILNDVIKQNDKDLLKTGEGMILFIDDEEINRILAEDILENIGYEVLTATGGLDGLEIYKKNKNDIDLIIVDFMMPEMNGKETFLELRKINSECKIILVSGYSDNEDISTMRQLGLNGELTKPYRIEEISNLIESVLS